MNNACAVALGWKPEGEEKQRQTQNNLALHCGGDTDKDGTHGQEQDRQQTIANSGGRMSRPCAPPGVKRLNLTFQTLSTINTKLFTADRKDMKSKR